MRFRRFGKSFCHNIDADIQDYAPVQNIFTAEFLCTIYYYYYCSEGDTLQMRFVHQFLFRCVKGYFGANWIYLKNADFCFFCVNRHASHILYLEKKCRQTAGGLSLLDCSNVCFNNFFYCFNLLEVKSFLLYLNHLLISTSDRKSTK